MSRLRASDSRWASCAACSFSASFASSVAAAAARACAASYLRTAAAFSLASSSAATSRRARELSSCLMCSFSVSMRAFLCESTKDRCVRGSESNHCEKDSHDM